MEKVERAQTPSSMCNFFSPTQEQIEEKYLPISWASPETLLLLAADFISWCILSLEV